MSGCIFNIIIKKQHNIMFYKLPISQQRVIISCVVDLLESLIFTEYAIFIDDNNLSTRALEIPYLEKGLK